MAQYMLSGMEVKPCSGPSMTYIEAPMITTMMSTKDKNTAILERLAQMARRSPLASESMCASLSTRKTRRSRSARSTAIVCAPG